MPLRPYFRHLVLRLLPRTQLNPSHSALRPSKHDSQENRFLAITLSRW